MIVCNGSSYANDERYQALVREGFCPECGRNSWHPRGKDQLIITCAHCSAAYSLEDFQYGPLANPR